MRLRLPPLDGFDVLGSLGLPDPRSFASWPGSAPSWAPSWSRWLPKLGPAAEGSVRAVVRWGAHHSGLPVILVGALTLVLSWRVIKRSFRLALEVVIALALLVVATRLGWLTW
jgi:hypothetical protein